MKRMLLNTFLAMLAIASAVAACASNAGGGAGPAAGQAGNTKPQKPAWEEKWAATLAAARKEGKVSIYGQVGPELRDALAPAVKNVLGLDLEVTTGKGAELSTKVLSESQAGVHNVDMMLWGASTHILVLKPKGALDRLDSLLIRPDVTDPAAWPDGKLPFVDKENTMVPLTSEVNQLLLVNTDVVKPGQISGWKDLLQPQWKGKIAMFDPTIGGSGNGWVALIITKAFGPVEGEKYLREFVAQEPVITKDSRQQIEWLARGRYPVTVAVDTQAAYTMQKAGAPITRLKAEEGGTVTAGGSVIGMPKDRPHPNASVALLNWLLSPAGEKVYCAGYGAPSARLGVPSEGVSPLSLPLPGEKLYPQDEEMLLQYDKARDLATVIFAPLLK